MTKCQEKELNCQNNTKQLIATSKSKYVIVGDFKEHKTRWLGVEITDKGAGVYKAIVSESFPAYLVWKIKKPKDIDIFIVKNDGRWINSRFEKAIRGLHPYEKHVNYGIKGDIVTVFEVKKTCNL